MANAALNANDQQTNKPLLDIKSRIARLKRLPPMPEMAQKIIQLNSKPDAAVKDLVAIVELDPSLTAQVMRYSSSPFFGYRGKVDSVHTAISRVLGYNMVMNLALGVTAARSFKMPKNVPLGLDAFWQHAVYSAAMVQALSSALPAEIRPPAGLAYLAGLLHNFGHLLLGHLFKQEFLLLNKFIAREPQRSVVDIEKDVLGVDHTRIGAWLLKAWRLPDEVVVATREHHNEYYQGPHAVYSQLVMLSDLLLKQYDICSEGPAEIPGSIMQMLELGEYQVATIARQVFEDCSGLDSMAMQLSA
jgi:HD-like signal output (HDOD) protein